MVSRDSKVQFAVVVTTIALATLWLRYGTTDAVASGLFVVCYVHLLAGSHVYLAARGDGGEVPSPLAGGSSGWSVSAPSRCWWATPSAASDWAAWHFPGLFGRL